MSFDGVLLTRLKDELEILKTGRISKITEIGDSDFIFTIRVHRQNQSLLLSFSPDFARIHLSKRTYDSIVKPKSFTLFLRKHIEGYFIENIETYLCDRIIYFTLQGYNEIQDLKTKYLICEVMGRYSNLILTDENFIILEALKHDGIGEYNRTILPNAKYEFPLMNKINPLPLTLEQLKQIEKEKHLQSPKDYIDTFMGISLNIAYPIFTYPSPITQFYHFLHIENKPCIFKNYKDKLDFYYHSFENPIEKEFSTLSEVLEEFYYKADLEARVRSKTNDLLNFVHRQIQKNEKKIAKFTIELQQKEKTDELRLYGELLLSAPNLKEKKKEITLFNYYTNTELTIPLDIKYTIVENSNRYFKKYQKSKISIAYIHKQTELAKNEIEYFKILEYQIRQASIQEALEIQDELIEAKYLFIKENKPKKKQKPKLLTYELNNTLISVGKNNLQNEYLTHKFAKANEMWFHIKDGAGSHVVVHKETELTEEEIRTAAMLAAYYSSMRLSSSVAVDYTRIRYIKKIPEKRNCFVTYTHHKTIYIDPNEETILKLKVKKQ